MPFITTRLANLADAGLIADLSRKTFYDSFAKQNSPENMEKFMKEKFSSAALIKEVGAEGNIFLLAFGHNDVVGYAKMRQGENRPEFENQSAIEIARIYAVQHAIGQGIGSCLMEKCIEIAKSLNHQVIWLGVWEHNMKAIDFYSRWGFEKFGEHDFVLGDDVQRDWLMKKKL